MDGLGAENLEVPGLMSWYSLMPSEVTEVSMRACGLLCHTVWCCPMAPGEVILPDSVFDIRAGERVGLDISQPISFSGVIPG